MWDKLKGSPKWKVLVADSAKDARRVSRVDEHNGAAADTSATGGTSERPIGNRRAKSQLATRSAAHAAVEVMRERNEVLRDAQATMNLATHIQLFAGVSVTDTLSGEYQECLTFLRGRAVSDIRKEMQRTRDELSTPPRLATISTGPISPASVASTATASSSSSSAVVRVPSPTGTATGEDTGTVESCGWGLWCTNYFKPPELQLPVTVNHTCCDCGDAVHNLCCQAMRLEEGVFKCGDCVGEAVWSLLKKPKSYDASTSQFELA